MRVKIIRTGIIHSVSKLEIMFPVLPVMKIPRPVYVAIDDAIKVIEHHPREGVCIALSHSLTKQYAAKTNPSVTLEEVIKEFEEGDGLDKDFKITLDKATCNEYYRMTEFINEFMETVLGGYVMFSSWYSSRDELDFRISNWGGLEKLIQTTDFFTQCRTAWLRYIKEHASSY